MLLLNWNNRNSKSQMSLQSQVWHGAQFPLLKLNLMLFTNPILWKNAQFKCKCNLHRGAESRYAVSIANNHLQRGKSTKARISSCQAEVCITCHSLPTFLPKPPASEPQLGRYKEVEKWGIFSDISSCTYDWLRDKGGSLFQWANLVGITIEIMNWPISFNKYLLVIFYGINFMFGLN